MNKDNENEEINKINPQINLNQFSKKPEDIVKDSKPSVLRMITMNQYLEEANKLSIPDQLFGNFWYEGEVCILFSDTNLGKSILAVQISNSITKGETILNFNTSLSPKKVAYLDIELFGKQVEVRYSNEFTNHYRFADNFYRLDIDPMTIDEDMTLEDQVLNDISRISKEKEIKIFIIDNITVLITDFEKSKNAIKLMKNLNHLKRNDGISFLVLAHVPKVDKTNPITTNHLAGSKALINLCDSAFAIGSSIMNEKIRYLKQIKARYVDINYGTTNVIVCHIQKSKDNMLKFIYDDTSKEILFLRTFKDSEKEAMAERIVKLRDEKKMTFESIAQELGMLKGTVNKIYHKAKKNEPVS